MKKILAFLFLSSLCFGQGVSVPPQIALQTVNGLTQPLAGATITVCPANTSGIPCSPASTSIFSDTALTVPLSNPFTADANGNYAFSVATGTYTVTVTGSGFAGYSYQLTAPIAALNGVVYAATGESVAHAITRLPAGGGCVYFGPATYPSGNPTVSTANVCLIGAGIPNFNSLNAPTALTGGTVIQGPINYIQGADHFVVENLGIDVGPNWVNNVNGGQAVNGLAATNNGQVMGAPQIQFPVIQNVAVLGYSLNAAFHAMLVENTNGAYISNVNLIYNQHGLVLKGTNATIVGVNSQGHSVDSVLVKSDSYAPSGSVNLSHININFLAAPGDTAGLFLQALGSALDYVNLSNSNIRNVGNWGVLLSGASSSFIVSDITIRGVNFDYPTGAGGGVDCIQLQSNVSTVTIDGINCLNFGAGIIVNTAATTQQNFTVSNSNFQNLTGNGIQLYGRSTVTGNILVSIGGNAIQSDNGVLTASNNNLASISGTAYNNNGGTVLLNPFTASLTTTAAGSDNVSILGMVSTGHCSLAPTNASAATNIATTYISAKTGNQITVTHTATANMNYDIMCVPY